MIEDYPDDEPCPSALFLGFMAGRPCHVVKESEKIDKLMKKFHKSDLLVHPLAAGELSLSEATA